MLALVQMLLAAFGFAYIMGHSVISLPVRVLLGGADHPKPFEPLIPYVGPFLVALVECPACLGWWTGVGIALVTSPAIGFWPTVFEAVRMGCMVSGSNFVLGRVTGLMQ